SVAAPQAWFRPLTSRDWARAWKGAAWAVAVRAQKQKIVARAPSAPLLPFVPLVPICLLPLPWAPRPRGALAPRGFWLCFFVTRAALVLASRYLNSAETVLLASVSSVQGVLVPVQSPVLPPVTVQPANV